MREMEVSEVAVVVGGVTFPSGIGTLVRPPILQLPPPTWPVPEPL